jgi:hypothetical protein
MQAQSNFEAIINLPHRFAGDGSDDARNVRLPDGIEIGAIDDGIPPEPRSGEVGMRSCDEILRVFRRSLDVARDVTALHRRYSW